MVASMFLRTAINVLQMLLLLAALVFALQQHGDMQINWQDHIEHYSLTTALLALLLLVLGILLLHRLLLTLAAMPKNWQRQQKNKRLDRSLNALSTGLAAITIGDIKTAENAVAQAQKYASHPQCQALSFILQAQIAEFRGDKVAMQAYLAQLKSDAAAPVTEPLTPCAETI